MKKTLYYLCLALPLTVYFYPGFTSSFECDGLLLAAGFYLFLRTVNPQRTVFTETIETFLSFLLLSLVYAIGWQGLINGYGNTGGRLLALYPLLLLAAVFLRNEINLRQTPAWYTKTLYAILSLLWISLLSLVLNFILLHQTSQFLFNEFIPSLVLILIIALSALLAYPSLRFHTWKQTGSILLLLSILIVPVWKQNLNTWWKWFKAGEEERAWAPYKYDDDPKQIEIIENKPYTAASLYWNVYCRILDKGFIPRYLNWDFFLRYRIAVQGMRKRDSALCITGLPPWESYSPEKFLRVKQLWDADFLTGQRQTEPNFPPDLRAWVDIEIDQQTGIVYALDLWGRVFSFQRNTLVLEWATEPPIFDAVDLELMDGAFIILRRHGQILTSKPLPLFLQTPKVTPYQGNALTLKIFPDHKAALAATTHGEIIPIGELPAKFPDLKKFFFGKPYTADIEIDLDSMGYYLLDIFGGVHSNHASGKPVIPHSPPAVAPELIPYWENKNMAVDFALDPHGRGISIYNRLGEVFTIAAKPYRETFRPPKTYPNRGFRLAAKPDKSFVVIESNGNIIPFPKEVSYQ